MSRKELRAQRLPRNDESRYHLFYDIETDGLDASKFLFGVVMDEDGEYTLHHTAEDMHERIQNEAIWRGGMGQTTYAFAHNGNRYDVWSMFDASDFLRMRLITQGETNVIGALEGEHLWWCDSRALFPQMGLADLGRAIHSEKGETPDEMKEGTYRATYGDDPSKWPTEHVDYCVQDCEIIRQAFFLYWDELNALLGYDSRQYYLAWTAASNAWRLWCMLAWPDSWIWNQPQRSRARATAGQFRRDAEGGVITRPLQRCWIDGEMNDAAQTCYFGGRSHVLTEMGSTTYGNDGLDVNAMYPAQMVAHDFPDPMTAKHLTFSRQPTTESLYQMLSDDSSLYLVECSLRASNGASLFLPHRNEDDRLKWDSTEFSGWLPQPELMYALEHGWEVEECSHLWKFKPFADCPFTEIQTMLYEKRLECKLNNDPRQFVFKIMGNSLYGVFGMKTRVEQITNLDEVDLIMSDPDYHEEYALHFWDRDLILPYLTSHDFQDPPFRQCYVIASFITSYARVELQRAIDLIGSEHCYYTDTDSIWFCSSRRAQAKQYLDIHESRLGAWDWVKQDVDEATWWEPKAYRMRIGTTLEVKHKGCSQSDGDLTKPQKHTQVRQMRTALRTGKRVGESHEVVKHSRRHLIEE